MQDFIIFYSTLKLYIGKYILITGGIISIREIINSIYALYLGFDYVVIINSCNRLSSYKYKCFYSSWKYISNCAFLFRGEIISKVTLIQWTNYIICDYKLYYCHI